MKLLVILNALFVIGLSVLAGCVQIEPQRSAATSQPISPIQTGAVDVCAIPEGEDDQFRIISSVVVTVVIDGAVREVRVDRANVGIGVGMAATDTSTTTSQMLSKAMMSDPVRELLKEYELEDTLAHAFGPAQAGNVIRVAGKDIDIPDGFCVIAFLPNVDCKGEQCAASPVYTIGNRQTGHILAVSTKTGEIGDASLGTEELDAFKKEFRWLVDAVGK